MSQIIEPVEKPRKMSKGEISTSSGRFSITKISSSSSFNDEIIYAAIDDIVLTIINNLHEESPECTFPLCIEFKSNKLVNVSIKDKTEFIKMFDKNIEILNLFNFDNVKFKLNNDDTLGNEIIKLMNEKGTLNKLKQKIFEWDGGKIFSMFPSYIGYTIMKYYYESLIPVGNPHESLYIDSETLKKYIEYKLMN